MKTPKKSIKKKFIVILYDCQFLTKLNIFLSYNSAIMLLGIYPKELITSVHIKNLYMNVHNNFLHNCQSFGATKMSFSKWMDK